MFGLNEQTRVRRVNQDENSASGRSVPAGSLEGVAREASRRDGGPSRVGCGRR